jgi:hypothetical protein
MMTTSPPTPFQVIAKTAITHTTTYFAVGLLAFTLLDYGTWYSETNLNLLMRPTSHPLVMAGPLFQPIRGVLFGIVFFLLRDLLFKERSGWLVLWSVLVVLGIINTFGPAPGSIEGLVYTTLPIGIQMKGLIEIVLQSLLLSLLLVYWVRRPDKKWLSWVMGLAFGLVMLLPTLGLLVR